MCIYIYIRSTPHPVTVTTRIITLLVGNPYKPSFATVTGWGVDPIIIYIYISVYTFYRCHDSFIQTCIVRKRRNLGFEVQFFSTHGPMMVLPYPAPSRKSP